MRQLAIDPPYIPPVRCDICGEEDDIGCECYTECPECGHRQLNETEFSEQVCKECGETFYT